MTTLDRFRSFSVTSFGITVSATVIINDKIALRAVFGHYAPLVLIVVSVISYELVFQVAVAAVGASTGLKKLYWGRLYLDGLWSYTSYSDGKEYRGIWRIDQDALGIAVVAFGLDDFRRRSTV